MQLTFWGVRGSYPVPGTATVRYGGHTSCVEVRSLGGSRLVVDAGTGLRALGQRMAREQATAGDAEIQYDIVLSHVHWDHIQGLPFFQPAYLGGTKIVVHAPRAAATEIHNVIGGITRHEFFPVDLEAAPAEILYQEVLAGVGFEIGDFSLLPIGLNHPFGALGYRIDADGESLAYVSDTAPFDRMLHKKHFTAGPEKPSDEDLAVLAEMRTTLVDSLKEVDTVIYDTHFTSEEYEKFPHWGHSTPEHALELCTEADVRRLVLYHHAPSHDDAKMDAIGEEFRLRGLEVGVRVVVAREGATLIMGAEDPAHGAVS